MPKPKPKVRKEYNYITRGGSSASNAFLSMPIEMLTDKFESTKIYENPDLLYDFNRGSLANYEADEPLFEEEDIRRDFQSASQITLRTSGARSDETPYMPDAFLELTELDPRGTALDPDIRKMADQAKYRYERYTNFYPDNDDSVPESYRNEQQVIRDKRLGFDWVKSHMPWFETSKDGRGTTNINGYKENAVVKITRDGQLLDLNNPGNFVHHGDRTIAISNNYPVGWYQTSDMDFKVSSYQYNTRSANAMDMNIRKMQGQGEHTQDDPMQFGDASNTKAMVALMTRIATERDELPVAPFQLDFEEKYLTYKKGKQHRRKDNTIDDRSIAENMVASIKKHKRQSRFNNKLSENDNTTNIDIEAANMRAGFHKEDRSKYNSHVIVGGRERKVKNYTSAKPRPKRNDLNQNDITDVNGMQLDDPINPLYKNMIPVKYSMDQSVESALLDEFRDAPARRIGSMESRAKTRLYQNLGDEALNDF